MNEIEGLEFDPVPHEYRFKGDLVPSVTKILELWSEIAKLPKEILIPASIRGTRVHLATELDDEGDLNEAWAEEVGMTGYVHAWRKCKLEHQITVTHRERRIWHPTQRYAGTLDVLCSMLWPVGRKRVEVPTLLDIKSGVWDPVHPMQTAAYGAPIKHKGRRASVYLHEDGTYQIEEHTDANTDWADFLACKREYDFKKRHNIL